jgi:micrococcal nuclease
VPRPRGRRVFVPRRPRGPSLWIALALVCLIALRGLRSLDRGDPFSFESPGPYRVERVVDGDTLVLAGGTRVRLIGVDAPETKRPERPVDPLGLEAAEFVRSRVEGRPVTLRFDRERRDRYHRVLAYVYLDDWFLNEELVRAGYSRAITRFPYSEQMKRRFRAAEQEAREAKRGMWAGR